MEKTEQFEIIREIGIDAGHRVTHHGSKCKNLHGHRYTVQACVKGTLFPSGEQEGMVLDFGFLKELMMFHIDEPCDHGMTLWINDPLVQSFLSEEEIVQAKRSIEVSGFWLGYSLTGKTYLVPFVPTAENMAKHWYERLLKPVTERTQGQGEVAYIKVWETPNGIAIYPAQGK